MNNIPMVITAGITLWDGPVDKKFFDAFYSQTGSTNFMFVLEFKNDRQMIRWKKFAWQGNVLFDKALGGQLINFGEL